MKRVILCALLLVLVLIMSGCGVIPMLGASVNPNRAYTFTADITDGENEWKLNGERSDVGKWRFAVAEPYALSGLEIRIDGGNATVALGGFQYDTSSLPVSSIESVTDGLEKLLAAEYKELPREGDEFVLAGDGIRLYLDSDFAPLRLETDSDVSVNFSAVTSAPLPEKIESEAEDTWIGELVAN